jgi:hypothetical protein
MLRILVIVFFWLCAIGLLTLSIWAEVSNLSRGTGTSTGPTKTSTHGPRQGMAG